MKKKLKIFLKIFIYYAVISFIFITTAFANTNTQNSSGDVLKDIRTFTYKTYKFAEEIDAKLKLALMFMNQWLITPENSDVGSKTATLQKNFATYTNTILNTQQINNDLQTQLTKEFLGDSVTPKAAPYANDLTYQTLLGEPFFNPDPRAQENKNIDPARTYIQNIAGLNITHFLPRDSWKGTEVNKKKYKDFYNTVTSIQTFNSHVLGEIYADYRSDGAASGQQNELIQQASNSDWFSTVASEPIGLVLRQILMYTSQLLTVQTQQLKTQKEILAATAMTNTLAILGNQFNENLLLNRATGKSQ